MGDFVEDRHANVECKLCGMADDYDLIDNHATEVEQQVNNDGDANQMGYRQFKLNLGNRI